MKIQDLNVGDWFRIILPVETIFSSTANERQVTLAPGSVFMVTVKRVDEAIILADPRVRIDWHTISINTEVELLQPVSLASVEDGHQVLFPFETTVPGLVIPAGSVFTAHPDGDAVKIMNLPLHSYIMWNPDQIQVFDLGA